LRQNSSHSKADYRGDAVASMLRSRGQMSFFLFLDGKYFSEHRV